jgi:cytochrome c biogenesis protein CcmG/thiol:disulfide interchange protein DsbE
MRRYALPVTITGLVVALLVALAIGISDQKANNSIAYSVASHHDKLPPDDSRQLPVLLDGDGARTRSLADYRGRVVLVNYFAAWCDGCAEEAPLMGKLEKLMAAHGGTVLGISTNDSPSKALGFMRRYHNVYPVLQDTGGDLLNAFNETTMPDSYVIGRDGKIVALNLYPLTMQWVRQNLMPILDRSG